MISSQSNGTLRELVECHLACKRFFDAPKTHEKRSYYLRLLTKRFGERPAEAVRRSDVEIWLAEQAWGDWTKASVVPLIKHLFNWAVEDDRLAKNPCKKLAWREGLPRAPIEEGDWRKLLRGTDATFRRVLFFCRHTGCRPGEMRKLLWGQIDWEHSCAVMDDHKTARTIKTRRPRVLYLAPLVVRLLRWQERHRYSEDEHVFLNVRGRPWSSSALIDRMERLRKQTGASAVMYSLRHRFGTSAVVNGVSIKAAAELLGHTSVKTTEKYYVHLDRHQQHLIDAAERAGRQPSTPRQ